MVMRRIKIVVIVCTLVLRVPHEVSNSEYTNIYYNISHFRLLKCSKKLQPLCRCIMLP